MLARLERAGLLLATEKEQFVPGRDPEGILLADILDAVRTLQTGRRTIEVRRVPSAARVMADVESAMRERLGARSLKDLIAAEPEPRPGIALGRARISFAGDGHFLQQDRPHPRAAARIDVIAHRRDALEHVAQIAGDGDFRHRILNGAVLDPEAGRAARVVAGHHVDALPHELGHQ